MEEGGAVFWEIAFWVDPEVGQEFSLFLTEAPSVLSTYGEWNQEERNSISNYQADFSTENGLQPGETNQNMKACKKVTYTVNKDLI